MLFFLLWMCVGCMGCRQTTTPAPPAGRTNVVLLMIDTLRADHLGTYGYKADTSPHLDRLAGEGVVFEQWFSTASWTRPGMATIVTGEFPGVVGVYEEKFDRLPDDAVLLSERLKDAGYVTVGVNSNPNLNAAFGFDQGFSAYLDAGVVWNWMKKGGLSGKAFSSKKNNLDDATLVVDRALSAVDEKVVGSGAPFYLQLVFLDPHWPYVPPDEHRQAVEAKGAKKFSGYDGSIRFADFEIQRLLDGLEQRGLMENTLVLVTSDHGEGLDDHPGVPDADQHGTHVYDSVTHVPMIFWHPGLPKGKRVDALASSIHLVPTVLDFVGLPADPYLPGKSVRPLMSESGPVELPEYVFSETDFRVFRKFAVRSSTQKFIRNDDCIAYHQDGTHEAKTLTSLEKKQLSKVPDLELYTFPGREFPTRNRANKDEAALASLQGVLAQWEKDVDRIPPLNRQPEDVLVLGDGTIVPAVTAGGEVPQLDAATLERLAALGYMDDGADGTATEPGTPDPAEATDPQPDDAPDGPADDSPVEDP